MFRPQAETGRWVTLGAYLTLALALIPLVGLALASQAEPPLFGSPPMAAGTIFSLLLRTLALALVVSVCSLVWVPGWLGAIRSTAFEGADSLRWSRSSRWLFLAIYLPE